MPQAAIDTYTLQSSADGNERVVGLLYGVGKKEAAREMLTGMVDDPATDAEYLFASDFLVRKLEKHRASAVTALLRDARTVWIDDAYRKQPEARIAAYFRREGWTVHHTEDALWQSLFGLVFWGELFGSESCLNSEFDHTPSCLRDNSFHVKYAERVAGKIARVETGQALSIVLRSIATANRQPNSVFAWFQVDVEAIRCLLENAHPQAVARVLRALASDYGTRAMAFPT